MKVILNSVAAATLVALLSGTSAAQQLPAILVGAYCSSARGGAEYAGAMAQSLKEHHFNAIIADNAFTKEMLDVFQNQGIAVIVRSDKWLDHPAVIAGLVGDGADPEKGPGQSAAELKRQYEALRQKTQKPIVPCVAGESLGLYGPSDPRALWQELAPPIQCFRWYGISRSHYGILYRRSDKGWLPLSSLLMIQADRVADNPHFAGTATPYWVVLPGFGKNEREAEYQNATPAQIRGMMHLALAYGAQGIVFYALQDHAGWTCLADEKSLKPSDGKYAAAAEVAALIEKHSALLRSLKKVGGTDFQCLNSAVDAIPLSNETGAYAYVVNKDTENPVTTRLRLWDAVWTMTSVKDVFSGQDLEVKPCDAEGYLSVSLTLAPGEGQLLATDAKVKPKK